MLSLHNVDELAAQLISIHGSSDAEDTPTRAPVQPAKAPVRKSRGPAKSTKIPALQFAPTVTPTSARPKATPSLAIKSESSGTFDFTPPSHNDIKGLPGFLGNIWAHKYLPAVYRASNRVQDPMAFATIGSDVDRLGGETVLVLQQVLDDLCPQNNWRIKWGDAICAKVCYGILVMTIIDNSFQAVSRLGERRSTMGRVGLRAVEEAFERPKYYGSLDGPEPGARLHKIVRADAEYALRFNGPALFKYPTPESCRVAPSHPDYIVRLPPILHILAHILSET